MKAIMKKLNHPNVDEVWDAQGGESEREKRVTNRIKSLRKFKGYERNMDWRREGRKNGGGWKFRQKWWNQSAGRHTGQ